MTATFLSSTFFYSLLQRYTSDEQNVLNFVYCIKTGHLVGGCENGIYGWKVKESRDTSKNFRYTTKNIWLENIY